ncbi:DUF2339 domain-containing protein [Acinetobacter tandoii]|uniref:DUF2339 domain-containing protein n=1 Tax=Acinetobacter tandoii DSM 14970 = CIP 107469 TaxID=1120927 RepID=R9BAA6_9GAMM|nr:DUF2339 domain-containing protein [Acinetobacter tandoii]EOR09296.1 hypothetical protein I593_01004 [Acinetobacter tandoii DSM 14970 = CIP 107469]
MYKNDKQGMVLLLIALTVLLAVAIVMQWQSTLVAAALGLTVVIVQSISNIHQRLEQLEQLTSQPLIQSAGIGTQKIVIYGAALVALWAYANTWIWLVGGALLVLLLCLIQLISSFQRRLALLEQPQQQPSVMSRTSTFVMSEQPLPPAMPTSGQLTLTQQQDVTVQQPQQTSVDSNTASSESTRTWWQPAVDWMQHGNPILRVAVALLMVGVVLLLRFASEHWQLSLGVKLGFIAVAGAVTTLAGYLLQRKNTLFAIALQGLGLAVIFLTLIFAHHFEVLQSLMTASVLFVMLLGMTVVLSLKQQALYLAILALSMAYLAPLLIPHTHPDVVFLFGYYFVINLAVVVVNYLQPWKTLHQIAFFVTMFIGGSVIGIYAEDSQLNTLDIILWLHIALFIWLSIRYSQLIVAEQQQQREFETSSNKKKLQPILDVGLIFSVPVLGFSLHAFLMHDSTVALTSGAAALAVTYGLLNFWIKRQHPQLSILAKSFFILAVVFTALIFPLAKGAHWTSTGWVIQGTALIVWGITERYRLSRYVGVALVLLSTIALMYQIWSNDDFPILITVIYAIAQFISAFYLLHYPEVEKYFSARILSGIFLVSCMYAGAIAGVELMHWQSWAFACSIAIATASLACFSIVVQLKTKLEWQSLQLTLLGSLLLLLYGLTVFEEVFITQRWTSQTTQFSFAISAVVLSLMLIFMQRSSVRVANQWWAAMLCLALASIGLAIFPQMPIVALGIVPVLYAFYGYFTAKRDFIDQISVWGLGLLWLLVLNLDSYSAVHYYLAPLLNFTDLLSLLMFAGLLRIIYRHNFETQSTLEWGIKISTILIGLLVFSSVVVRAMHHYLATPLWGSAIWHDGSVQLSLTLLWVVLAFVLMTFSSQRHIRQIWFVGAALLGIVVVKLLLLDLSQSGTLTRVISFIGSGVVMLVIAYIAPLPPSLNEQKKER